MPGCLISAIKTAIITYLQNRPHGLTYIILIALTNFILKTKVEPFFMTVRDLLVPDFFH